MKVLKKHANVPPETSISTWVGYDDDHIYTMGFVHEKLKQPQFYMMRVPATALLLKCVPSVLPPYIPRYNLSYSLRALPKYLISSSSTFGFDYTP